MIYYLGLLGVAVFAISGSLAAGKKGLDWVGVTFLAIVTSLGGGTIRDLLLQRKVFWIDDPTYLWVALGAAAFTIVAVRFVRSRTNALLIADALGLALFSIVGAQIAEAATTSVIVVILMGVITGVAGGVIRDVLTSEIPLLFRATEPLYSVAALVGILGYLLLEGLSVDRTTAFICGAALCAGLRFAAIMWRLKVPAFQLSVDE